MEKLAAIHDAAVEVVVPTRKRTNIIEAYHKDFTVSQLFRKYWASHNFSKIIFGSTLSMLSLIEGHPRSNCCDVSFYLWLITSVIFLIFAASSL